MEREMWKWIFQEIDDASLYKVVQNIGVRIKGFRKIDPSMIKNVRIKCIRELLKPHMLNKAKLFFQAEYEQDAIIYDQMSKEELLEESTNHDKIIRVLIYLLLFADEEKRLIGSEIYNKVAEKMETFTITEHEHDEEHIKMLQGLIIQLEEKIKKQEKKIDKVVAQLVSKSQELTEKEHEIKKYEKEIRQQKKNVEEIVNERNYFERELESKKNMIITIEKEMEQLREENNRHLSTIRQFKQERNMSEIAADHIPEASVKEMIAVIGDVRKPIQCAYPIFSLDQIEDMLSSHAFEDYRYVCVLRFSLPPGMLRNLKKSLRSEQIKEFFSIDQFIQWERLL